MSNTFRHNRRAQNIALNSRKDKTEGLQARAKKLARRRGNKEQAKTIDLHKLRLEDALAFLDLEINQRFMRGEEEIIIITGAGKVLAPEVREFLQSHALVNEIRPSQNPGLIKAVLHER